METNNFLDPFAFMKDLWGSVVVPAIDPVELEKKIRDLKTVEGWLSMNLGMLQSTIKTMEMQKTALDTLHKMHESSKEIFTASVNNDAQAASATPSAAESPIPQNENLTKKRVNKKPG